MIIKLDRLAKKLIYFCVIWSVLVNSLIVELGLPSQISYLPDICWVIIAVILFFGNKKNIILKIGLGPGLLVLAIYTLSLIFGIILNVVPLSLVIWAVRNTFRFFIFYYACICYLEKKDVEKIIEYLFILNIVSFILALYQHFVLGFIQDDVGGIFGYGNGAALNTFQSLLMAYYFSKYMQKRGKIKEFIIVLVTTSIVAAIAEEKAYFIYLVVIIAVYFFTNKPTLNMAIIIVVFGITFSFAVQYLYATNEWMARQLLSIDDYLSYANESYGISRLDPFGEINEMFFKENIMLNLFGYGFGSTEISDGGAFFNSAFSQKYLYTQYVNFTSQMRFLETGYIGMFSYIFFFIAIIFYTIKVKNKGEVCDKDKFYISFSFCYTSVVIISIWMSAALRSKEAYIIYFGLAIIAIINKESNMIKSNGREIRK